MAITHLRRPLVLLSGLLLAACASFPEKQTPVWPYPEPPATDTWGYERAPVSAPADSGQRQPSTGDDYRPPQDQESSGAQPGISSHPTVVALVEQADRERSAGQLDRAAASLERAIRIVNNDPLPWLKLAELRFEQGNLIQAENFARRSLSFAPSGATARDSWLLIADIKRLQGDDMAAENARRKALES